MLGLRSLLELSRRQPSRPLRRECAAVAEASALTGLPRARWNGALALRRLIPLALLLDLSDIRPRSRRASAMCFRFVAGRTEGIDMCHGVLRRIEVTAVQQYIAKLKRWLVVELGIIAARAEERAQVEQMIPVRAAEDALPRRGGKIGRAHV